MSKTISWPARVTYIFIALALALSLVLVAIPVKTDADPGLTKWSKVKTPSETDWVIAQDSDIYDFDIGPDGETIYAVGRGHEDNDPGDPMWSLLWKSEDGGVTWDDITDELESDVDFEPLNDTLYFVAVAPDDADFLAVAGELASGEPFVYGSDDGGDSFADTAFKAVSTDDILCLDMSADRDDAHGVAVGTDGGELWIYEAGSVWGGTWKEASDVAKYAGWKTSRRVTSVAFSPNWAADDTILCLCAVEAGLHTADPDATYQQSALWGTTKAWNDEAGSPFPAAVKIIDAPPLFDNINAVESGTGIALPDDFTGYDSGLRYNWVYVNWDTDISTSEPTGFDDAFDEVGQVFRIKGSGVKYAGIACERWDTSASYPLMASISMYGEIDDGNLMVGLLGEKADGSATDCCKGVQVYRTSEWPIDYCCPQWSSAKKPPTGMWNCVVAYTADGSKAYATTSSNAKENAGKDWDESAFSMSEVEEVGKYWNQPSLIDTFIDYLSDVGVNPACGIFYLFSVNDFAGDCGCDSVWSSTDDGSSYLRIWCKELDPDGVVAEDTGLIRTAPEEEEEILTIYLVDQGTNTIYWNDDSGLTNWQTRKVSPLDDVIDLAVEAEDIIYALSSDGKVSMSDKHGGPGSWSKKKDAKAGNGHTIAAVDGHVLVGGTAGSVGYSDDSASSFSRLGSKGELGAALVHVVFDTYFDENDAIYVALTGGDLGIWRWVIDDSTSWTDLKATAYSYYGIVTELSKDGNPKTKAANGGVLYAVYYDSTATTQPASGVARCLDPAATACCASEAWDYLDAKLSNGTGERFNRDPSALRICGCLSAATNSKLFAIDTYYAGAVSPDTNYKMSDGKDGTVWTYEDCFAKAGVDLSVVADGSTVASDPCVCANEKFVLEWERLCNECEYDIDISLNSGFTQIVLDEGDLIARYGAGTGGFYDPPKNAEPSVVIWEGALDCNTTYYWRVRTRYAETPEAIRSFWSDTWSFTVEAGPTVAIGLTSPDDGATNLPLTSIGFTWTSVADATSYDWVLSANADLSSPVETKTGLADTAYTYTGTLKTSTTYFWRVTAMKDDNVFSESDISTFITAPEPVPPPPPPAEPLPPVTPAWVWVVIGLGAVLVIVVIVLIFRTRRV